MAEDALAKYKEDFFLLLEAGFLAVNARDEDSAIKLFRACSVLRPGHTFPKVGFGYLHLCKLEIKQAITLFSEVLEKEPNNEMAKALLGICLSMGTTTTTQGETLLTSLLTQSQDPGIKELANTSLNFVETFIKKAASPVEPQKPKNPPRT